MKRLFVTIVSLDAVLLLIPTRWLGPRVEFWIAAALIVVTALLWLGVRVSQEDY